MEEPDGIAGIRPRRWPWVVLSAVCLSGLAFWGASNWTPGEVREAGALFESSGWRPSHASALSKVDLVRVHAELLPSWGIASANIELEGAAEAEAAAAKAMEEALGADRNLLDLFLQIRKLSKEPVENADEILKLVGFWSAYLDGEGAPFLVQGNVVSTGRDAFFYLKTYEVRQDLQLKIGEEFVRARAVSRLDRTNVQEAYLGATSPGQEEATVVLDRLAEFAVSRVWPMLASEDLTPLGRAVVAEVEANLGAEALQTLRALAPERRQMQQVLDAIEARRECGSTFMVRTPEYAGLAERDLLTLERLGAQAQGHPCPDVTVEEAQVLRQTSRVLAEAEGLGAAVRALVAMLAANVAVHEARHVVDDRLVDGLREPLECAGCPENMSVMTRAELSAYLASFAWSPAPYTTFFQACDATEGQGGPHGRAMAMILDKLQTFCGDAPPELAQRAAGLEQAWLGRSVPVEIQGTRLVGKRP